MDYLKAAVALIGLLKELVDWLKVVTKEDPTKFIKETHAAITKLKSAKTVEEQDEANKELRDIIGRL